MSYLRQNAASEVSDIQGQSNMVDREYQEQREYEYLSQYATKAAETKGRLKEETECTLRTAFQRDRDRIIHSKAFRRLMHKTQVFLSPEGDHYRTRLTHTIEVSQIARTIARGLALNEDLTEAVALGHDLGHTPFGHSGEAVLNEIYPYGFRHNEQSLRVVDKLEISPEGRRGMNLTWEVRDGILNHSGSGMPATPEGQIVRTSDRIAYINHDIDDALRSGVIREDDLPEDCIKYLGSDHRTRIDTLVRDMINNSKDSEVICLSEEAAHYMDKLRAYMFRKVYNNENVKKAEQMENVEKIICGLYDHLMERPEKLPRELQQMRSFCSDEELVKDNVAGMTDRYAINMFKKWGLGE